MTAEPLDAQAQKTVSVQQLTNIVGNTHHGKPSIVHPSIVKPTTHAPSIHPGQIAPSGAGKPCRQGV
ncbi:MAG: hypothetical protein AAGH99_06220 [Planctomycetota bacterium]